MGTPFRSVGSLIDFNDDEPFDGIPFRSAKEVVTGTTSSVETVERIQETSAAHVSQSPDFWSEWQGMHTSSSTLYTVPVGKQDSKRSSSSHGSVDPFSSPEFTCNTNLQSNTLANAASPYALKSSSPNPPDFLTGDVERTPSPCLPGVQSNAGWSSSSPSSLNSRLVQDFDNPFSYETPSSSATTGLSLIDDGWADFSFIPSATNVRSNLFDSTLNGLDDTFGSLSLSPGDSPYWLDGDPVSQMQPQAQSHCNALESYGDVPNGICSSIRPECADRIFPINGHDSALDQSEMPEPTKGSSYGSLKSFEHETNKKEAQSYLENFVAAGGGKRIFKVPGESPVDPDSPVPFDLRPSPERTEESTRTLACTRSALWAGCDASLKVWDIQKAMNEASNGKRNQLEDVDAAALASVTVMPTLCLSVDVANKIVYSAHKDGTVIVWPMEVDVLNGRMPEPVLSWNAHRGPIFSMTITSYGELWTGSEEGSIRAWPWEAISSALSVMSTDRSSATSLIVRSYIDLRARGTAAGAAGLANLDVVFLVANHSNGRVWSGGPYSLALWDSRTRDVLKVFGQSMQPEFSSPDVSPVREPMGDEDVRVTYTKISRKEKITGTLNFFQRSRNVVMGAADAVRRVASGGQTMEETRKLEALVVATDGMVWGGYANGLVIKWDSLGNRLQELHNHPVSVRSLCVVGTRIWVGYADGKVQILDEIGKVIGGWLCHGSAIIKMARSGNYVFTLGASGEIRGWNAASPCPIDKVVQMEMISRIESYTEVVDLHMLAATWNVSEEKPSVQALQMWLTGPATQADIVIVGLQETEMGASAIAMSAAKESVGQGNCSASGQWWLNKISDVLNDGSEFDRIGYRQLAGMLIGIWVRRRLVRYVGDVDAAAVACGFGRALGNKGAVGLKIVLFRRTFCFINSHFAAHADAITRRNADFEYVYHRLAFGHSVGAVGVAASAVAAGVSSAVQMLRGSNVRKLSSPEQHEEMDLASESSMPELSDASFLIWIGDFNYRIIDLSYDDVITLVSHKQWDKLLSRDQLRTEMAAGHVFQGMKEAAIRFPPTYKFDKGCILGYDSSEKRRVPAWCDRVLFRDSFDGTENSSEISLFRPISASVLWYDSCMNIVESDHKPVRCMLDVSVATVNQAARRREFGHIMQDTLKIQNYVQQLNVIPETVLSTEQIILEVGITSSLKIFNECKRFSACFYICSEGAINCEDGAKETPRGAYGFPRWLQVLPSTGVILPNDNVEIAVRYAGVSSDEEFSYYIQDEDHRQKATKLVIYVEGAFSSISKHHRVCVYYHPSSSDGLRRGKEQITYLQRTEAPLPTLSPEDKRSLRL